ncbi:MAG TPA: SGNH/GDSL hydrolase family protein, partial [Longimicrobiales bacterium]|nr:SGNH/GDSL hydrolase family protein [Longimicrobiales bacterium]
MTNARRPVSLLRDAWVVTGLTILLFLALEGLFRLQGAARRVLAPPAPEILYDSEPPWWPDQLAHERAVDRTVRWAPYIHVDYGPHPATGATIEESGVRTTVHPAPVAAQERTVFLFGGSTMFGTYQRDSETIASNLAKLLHESGRDDVRVVNHGVPAYVLTQEAIRLALLLRQGARPSAVVFYDGINDVFSAVQKGQAGWPQNEVNRRRDFQFGRRAFNWDASIQSEAAALLALAEGVLSRSALIARLLDFVRPPSPRREVIALGSEVIN